MGYVTFGEGDILIIVDTPMIGCDSGYWMRKTDPGYESLLSIQLSAFHAKSTVRIHGHDDQLWNGDAGSKYCKLNWVRIIN